MRNIPNGTSVLARIGGMEVGCEIEQDTGEGYMVIVSSLYHQPLYNQRQISYVDVVEVEDAP